MSGAPSQAPRILVLANVFPAVSETFVVDHVLGLARQGWSVTVAAPRIDRDRLAALTGRPGGAIEALTIPPSSRRRWRRACLVFRTLWRCGGLRHARSPWVRELVLYSEGLERICSDIEPALIHAHFGPNGIMAAFATRRRPVPLLVDFHGYDVTVIPKRHGWDPYRRWLGRATAIAHSGFVQALIETHLPCRVRRVPLGVDAAVFSAPHRAERWARDIRFLFVGRLLYQKGVHVALGMMAMLRRHMPQHPAHLTVCGDGPERDFLGQCARAFGVEAQVTFTGAVSHDEVAACMRDADVLLIPSVPVASGWEEAFCRVAIEGMAMHMAVIGSRTGGLEETIGAGGHTFRAGSAMSLFREVEELLVHGSPKREGDRAAERVRRFAIENMNDAYAEIVSQSLSV